MSHRGDAGDSLWWLCYRVGPGSTAWLLSGELGGKDRALTGLAITHEDRADCPRLKGSGLTLAAPGMGVRRERIEHRFGLSSAHVYSENTFLPGGANRLRVLAYRFANGLAAAILATQVTTF